MAANKIEFLKYYLIWWENTYSMKPVCKIKSIRKATINIYLGLL